MKGHQQPKPVEGLTPIDIDEGEFRKAVERAQNKRSCWVISGQLGASLLPETFDFASFRVSDQARIAASKGLSRKLIAVAEAAGYSQEICGYHKVTIGYAYYYPKLRDVLTRAGIRELMIETHGETSLGPLWLRCEALVESLLAAKGEL